MPAIKPISGHASASFLRNYLTRGGRALALDFVNMDAPEAGTPGAFDWAAQMDATRAAFGNDVPWRGMRVRTYKHYVVSPDPKDRIGLAALRFLAVEWAQEHFADYEVAVVYHNDNRGGIPHAHVVVNNTNLETGRRLQDPDPGALNRSLQQLAASRGLRHFEDERKPEGVAARAARDKPRTRARSLQREHIGRAEAELTAQGKYSWTADIRGRVRIARMAARSEAEFRSLLGSLGVEVADNSAKAARRDWVYSLSSYPARRVSGEKLGLDYGRESLLSLFGDGGARRLPDASERELARIAKEAVALSDVGELRRLSLAVALIETHQLATAGDLDALVGQRRRDAERGDPDADAVEELAAYIRKANILPDSRPLPPRRESAGDGRDGRSARKGDRGTRATWERSLPPDDPGRGQRGREGGREDNSR